MQAMTIALTRGKVALIDALDYPLIQSYAWRAQRSASGGWYAQAWDNAHPGGRAIVSMHRIIMAAPAGTMVDHISHDGLDNRRRNLRFASHWQNKANGLRYRNNRSGYKGVYARRGKWDVQVRRNGHLYYVGTYADIEDAARAYDAAARKLFGEFACCNFALEVDPLA